MTICTVQFDYKGQNMYTRLLKVLKASVLRVMPDVNFKEIILKCPGSKVPKVHFKLSNTLKLREWTKWLDSTDDNTVFMDCDMMLLQSIDDAFEMDFDVGYTVRTSAAMPMNGGVVFAKPTEGARKFLHAWLDVNEKMFTDERFHAPYRAKYAGMNQAAFGYLLEHPVDGVNLAKLPCAIWNSCSEDWKFVDKFTKVVHVKSVLRKVVLAPNHRAYTNIAQIWRMFEKGEDPSPLIDALSGTDTAFWKSVNKSNRDGVFVGQSEKTDEMIRELRSYRKLPTRDERRKQMTSKTHSYAKGRKKNA